MTTQEGRLTKIEGQVAALIDMFTSKQATSVDGEKTQKFIENYAFVLSIVENDSINAFFENISLTQQRFNDVSTRIDGLLAVAETESDKLISQMGGGASGVALNMADISMFQVSVSDAYKSMLEHLNDIDITGKINSMQSALSEALTLISSMRSQKEQINVLLQKVADNKALIDNMEDVNNDQTLLIENTQNLTVELEKQIENYAFYSEEFDKVYVTAKNFVTKFGEMSEELDSISSRNGQVEQLLADIISLSTQDFTEMESYIDSMKTSLNTLALSTADKIDGMIHFINEYNAVGTSFLSIKDRLNEATAIVEAEISVLDNVIIGYTEA